MWWTFLMPEKAAPASLAFFTVAAITSRAME